MPGMQVEAVMKNRILAATVAMAIAATSGTALADNGRHNGRDYRGNGDADYARVVRVEPLMERVRYSVPVEQCWNEGRVRDDGYRGSGSKVGAAIMGSVVGAVFGNALGGHGDSRRAATVGGAVLGAAVGNEIGKNDARRDYREPRYEEVQRCSTRYEERFDERVTAYRVTYDYNGRRQVTQLPYDPGRYLRVSVDVHPLG
jgi:uncharacterized protein YcfJ